MVTHTSSIVHFLQHGDLFGYDKKARTASSLWASTIWSIWKARNDLSFSNIDPECLEYYEIY